MADPPGRSAARRRTGDRLSRRRRARVIPGCSPFAAASCSTTCDAIVARCARQPALLVARRARDRPAPELYDVGKRGGDERVGDRRRRSTSCSCGSRAKASASCGSRAATRSCSGAAARRRRRSPRRRCRSRSCPGVTAGIAAPAYAGIPVTHRGALDVGHVRHRPRGSRQGAHADRLGGARAHGRHDRAVHGGEDAAAHRGGARRAAGMPRRDARRGDRVGHARRDSAPSSRRSSTLADAMRPSGIVRAGDHGHRLDGRCCATRSRGSTSGRCSGGASSSRAPTAQARAARRAAARSSAPM